VVIPITLFAGFNMWGRGRGSKNTVVCLIIVLDSPIKSGNDMVMSRDTTLHTPSSAGTEATPLAEGNFIPVPGLAGKGTEGKRQKGSWPDHDLSGII